MGELTVKESNSIVAYKYNNQEGKDLPKPFVNKIYLFSTHVAGTAYAKEPEKMSDLTEGQELQLYREAENRYDKKAIAVHIGKEAKIGYIPRHDNAVFSRLMDAGKKLYAITTNIRTDFETGLVRFIDIDVYMED